VKKVLDKIPKSLQLKITLDQVKWIFNRPWLKRWRKKVGKWFD